MTALGFALAAVIGLSLGMLGGGGSILTVPIFVYILGFGAKQAIAMSFPVVGMTSLVGAVGHWRNGNVSLRAAVPFGLITMSAAFVGARFLSHFLTDAQQLALLAIVMLGAAFSLARSRQNQAPEGEALAKRPLLLAVTGFAVGLITGIVGVGGGFLIVPALVLLAGVPFRQAVGTSLVVIAMNTITGFLGYVGRVAIPWWHVGMFTLIAIVGILAGTRLVKHVSQTPLRRTFSVFLLLMAVLILWENRRCLTPDQTGSAEAPSCRGPSNPSPPFRQR